MTKSSHQQGFPENLFFRQAEFSDNDAGSVFHGFFGRRGGESKDIYASLNCGPGSGEALSKVQQNRKIVSAVAGCSEPAHLLGVHQVHGSACLAVSEPWGLEERPEADAMVTDVPGLALSVLSADCTPVLFQGQADDGKVVVGAAHAGWGGALNGVLENVIGQMQELEATLESIRVVIGPCIGQASYEVQDDFSVAFIEEDEVSERFFKAGQKGGHLMFDLPGYCAFRLARAGVKTVFIKDLDTYFNEEDFFSYRRSVHRGEKDYGRQISVIMIKGGSNSSG